MVTFLLLASLKFVDVAAEAGVSLVNVSGESDKQYIVEVNGNGAAFFDYDDDGDMDLLVVNGSTLEKLADSGSPLAALYRNDGGSFTDVTEASGLTARGWGMGVCVADVDNDGARDFYLTAYGPNRLFRNRGDGTFVEIASSAGVDDPLYGTGCSFADYNGDGNVDLYVANYLTFDRDAALERGETPNCQFMGMTVMCGPRHFQGEPDRLFQSNGDRTFENVTEAAGISDPGYYGLGVVSGDLDDDGWIDIYVANDSRPNFYFRNNGDGTFEDDAARHRPRAQRRRSSRGRNGRRLRRLRQRWLARRHRDQLLPRDQYALPRQPRGHLHRRDLPRWSRWNIDRFSRLGRPGSSTSTMTAGAISSSPMAMSIPK